MFDGYENGPLISTTHTKGNGFVRVEWMVNVYMEAKKGDILDQLKLQKINHGSSTSSVQPLIFPLTSATAKYQPQSQVLIQDQEDFSFDGHS